MKLIHASGVDNFVEVADLTNIPADKRCMTLSTKCNLYVAAKSTHADYQFSGGVDMWMATVGDPAFKRVAAGLPRSGASESSWSGGTNRCMVLE